MKEEQIVSMLEQVLLSFGAVVQKCHRDEPSAKIDVSERMSSGPYLVASCNAEGRLWAHMKILLGVNEVYQRIVLVVISPSSISSKMDINSLLSSSISIFTEYSQTAIKQLTQALDTQKWTLNHLHPTQDNYCSDMAEGVLDLGFVRDAMSIATFHMNAHIISQVEHVDATIKAVELKCAKLMTLLKPTYQRAGISLPEAPLTRSLASYPLTLLRPSLRDCSTLDQAKMLLLLARKAYRSHFKACSDDTELASMSSQPYQVAYLAQEIVAQLTDWQQEELTQRMQRKLASVKDRYEALQRYRLELVLTLHNRFAAAAAVPSLSSSSSSSSLYAFLSGGHGHADRRHHAAVLEHFPFLQHDEPLLFEAAATASCAGEVLRGALYVTLAHVLFHSPGSSLLRSAAACVKVVPIKTIAQLSVASSGSAGSVATALTKNDDSSSNSTSTSTSSSTGLRLVDQAGEQVLLVVADGLIASLDLHERLHDLIALLMRDKLYMLLETAAAKPAPPVQQAASSGGDSGSMAVDEMSALLREIEAIEGAEGVAAATAVAPSNEASTPAAEAQGAKKKTLGANIQVSAALRDYVAAAC